MRRLADKVAIVTGSSSGIGKAIALTFAAEGAKVVLAARRWNLCEEVASQIARAGGAAVVVSTDVTEETQVDHLIGETVRQYGRLDVLVNNAGIGGSGPLAEVSTETFDRIMATNLRGTFFCCRAGFRQMRRNGGGTIINMSSVAGVDAWAGTGTYSASKYGVLAMTKALADEGRAHGIKASAICPGAVANELVDAEAEVIERSGKISPFDVAEAAVYLASLRTQTVVHRIVIDRLGADW